MEKFVNLLAQHVALLRKLLRGAQHLTGGRLSFAGGLGHLIAIGIALSLDEVLLAGGILTALMAVAADFLMSIIEERLVPPSV